MLHLSNSILLKQGILRFYIKYISFTKVSEGDKCLEAQTDFLKKRVAKNGSDCITNMKQDVFMAQ